VTPSAAKLSLAKSLHEALTTTAGLTDKSIQQNLGKLLQCIGKLNGPGCRVELIMDISLLPFIFSIWAAISFLLFLQAILSKNNIIHLVAIVIQGIQQVYYWMGLLLWIFVTSYLGHFWWLIIRWIFFIPIILFTFFWSVYNFGSFA
jgi:hypothetical protein